MIVWIGVDPGGRDTGIVLRSGSNLLGYVVRTCTAPPGELATVEYGRDVIAYIREERERAEAFGHQVRIAVEGLVKPSRRRGAKSGEVTFLNPVAVMGVALVWGSVTGAFLDAVVVRPDGHGKAPLPTYPKVLVSARTTKGTGDILRHCRSAWDIAGEGPRAERYPELGLRA